MQRLLFAFLLCALATAARADGPDYSYIRLGYAEETLPNEFLGDAVFSGRSVDLSLAYDNRWVILWSSYSADPEEPMRIFHADLGIFVPARAIPQEFDGYGLLYHTPMGMNTDFQISYEKGEMSFWYVDNFAFRRRSSKDGDRVAAGLNSKFGSLEAKLLRREFRFDDSIQGQLNKLDEKVLEANYYFNKKYSAGLSFITNDYTDRLVANVGYSFN